MKFYMYKVKDLHGIFLITTSIVRGTSIEVVNKKSLKYFSM